MSTNKEVTPRYDGRVLIAITAIVTTSVTILGVVAIQMTMLVNANTKTRVNVDTVKPSFSMELEKTQPLDKKQDGCLLAQNNRLIYDNK